MDNDRIDIAGAYIKMWVEIYNNTIEFIFVDHRLWFFLLANIVFAVLMRIMWVFISEDN